MTFAPRLAASWTRVAALSMFSCGFADMAIWIRPTRKFADMGAVCQSAHAEAMLKEFPEDAFAGRTSCRFTRSKGIFRALSNTRRPDPSSGQQILWLKAC